MTKSWLLTELLLSLWPFNLLLELVLMLISLSISTFEDLSDFYEEMPLLFICNFGFSEALAFFRWPCDWLELLPAKTAKFLRLALFFSSSSTASNFPAELRSFKSSVITILCLSLSGKHLSCLLVWGRLIVRDYLSFDIRLIGLFCRFFEQSSLIYAKTPSFRFEPSSTIFSIFIISNRSLLSNSFDLILWIPPADSLCYS